MGKMNNMLRVLVFTCASVLASAGVASAQTTTPLMTEAAGHLNACQSMLQTRDAQRAITACESSVSSLATLQTENTGVPVAEMSYIWLVLGTTHGGLANAYVLEDTFFSNRVCESYERGWVAFGNVRPEDAGAQRMNGIAQQSIALLSRCRAEIGAPEWARALPGEPVDFHAMWQLVRDADDHYFRCFSAGIDEALQSAVAICDDAIASIRAIIDGNQAATDPVKSNLWYQLSRTQAEIYSINSLNNEGDALDPAYCAYLEQAWASLDNVQPPYVDPESFGTDAELLVFGVDFCRSFNGPPEGARPLPPG